MPVQRPGRVLAQQILAKSSMVDRWAKTGHTESVDGKKPLGWGKLCALETKAVENKGGGGADPPLARIILRPALRYSWFLVLFPSAGMKPGSSDACWTSELPLRHTSNQYVVLCASLRHTSNQYVLLWHEGFPAQDSQASDIHCLAEAEPPCSPPPREDFEAHIRGPASSSSLALAGPAPPAGPGLLGLLFSPSTGETCQSAPRDQEGPGGPWRAAVEETGVQTAHALPAAGGGSSQQLRVVPTLS